MFRLRDSNAEDFVPSSRTTAACSTAFCRERREPQTQHGKDLLGLVQMRLGVGRGWLQQGIQRDGIWNTQSTEGPGWICHSGSRGRKGSSCMTFKKKLGAEQIGWKLCKEIIFFLIVSLKIPDTGEDVGAVGTFQHCCQGTMCQCPVN